MFRHVAVAMRDRVDVLEAAGVVLTTKDGRPALPLGCGALRGTCCSVYEDRPLRCELFTCALYRRHESGEVSTDEALATISKTRDLHGIVWARLAELFDDPDIAAPGRSFADAALRLREMVESAPDRTAFEEANSLTLLYVSAFDQRIDRVFRNTPAEVTPSG